MKNVIEYILAHKILRQVDIANQLNVSRAQVTKWKNGDYLPAEREEQLLTLAGLFGDSFEWAILVGSEDNGIAWMALFEHLNEVLEVPYVSFEEQSQQIVKSVLTRLQSLGCQIPLHPFDIHSINEDEPWDDFTEFLYELIDAYADLANWTHNNITTLGDNYFEHIFDEASELEHYLIDLATANISETSAISSGIKLEHFKSFVQSTKRTVEKCISKLCHKLKTTNLPIHIDYFKLLNLLPGELAHEDEYFDFFGKNEIEYYLPFNQREILQNSRDLKRGIEELHLKIDMLLSEEQRQLLDTTLEIYKPSLHPLLQNKI